ncbi:DNA double-strand break repair nuclease NurA [Picosynechococcus sp. PCC 73109]|uniref:DNA double-strand break repair nuclease NurA n=1 Tax=Picosynechococcus sp. PCC 73109 TaxID=374982 RepID=UPI0007459258|nr:DNA double-strand break repair nuclease NurA [Picosynechococcus sp. PCC 73109]AMA10669.1 hypothetical protein AWQ23_14580 [Picosynechococcus sp. PCC 73109]
MRFDLNLRAEFRSRLQDVAQEMQEWQGQADIGEKEIAQIRESIVSFEHTTDRPELRVAGVDGSGDFPMLSYEDSFVYLSIAQGTVYQADVSCGLREVAPLTPTVFDVAFIPESRTDGAGALDGAMERLLGRSLSELMEASDYRTLKAQETGNNFRIEVLLDKLIRPHGSDTSNLAIQLRTTAEMGAALRLMEGEVKPDYVLMDTTFSLPLLASGESSLAYEHAKRLCCVLARQKGIGFFTLSKSHGLPSIERLEQLVAEVQGQNATAEHWFLRIPEPDQDGWALSLAAERRLPPPGAVTYLVRFHRPAPVLRLDMDRFYWDEFVRGETAEETRRRECKIFEDLDYTCHDQRVYGYPYPIKAAHDRASLMEAERVALRKQLIAEAIACGMSPKVFRDVSRATGHA